MPSDEKPADVTPAHALARITVYAHTPMTGPLPDDRYYTCSLRQKDRAGATYEATLILEGQVVRPGDTATIKLSMFRGREAGRMMMMAGKFWLWTDACIGEGTVLELYGPDLYRK